MSASTINLSDGSFEEEVIKSNVPVLVDFWAPWCGPCQRVTPIVEELASDFDGKAKIAKVDIDECPGVAGDYGVMSIPTLILFKNGEEVSRFVGPQPKAVLADLIKEHS